MKKLLTYITVLLIGLMMTATPVYAEDTICKEVDGAYFGRSGEETDKGTYEKECVSHSCELVADAYFGVNGNEVTKEQFESECGATVYESFPSTGRNSTALFLIIGVTIIGGATLLIKTAKEQ